ncbi:MAG: TetR family transcriptional regulator [Gemmatimonadetes bacterium]|nr:TetR family transcriptional regulator [Gemmatimonadota bacterium]
MGPPIKRGRGLTRERVIDAALVLVDRHGLGALTMRRLGQALSVEAMSLYRYLPSKTALHEALSDRVLREIALPAPTGRWRRDLTVAGTRFWRALNRHPNVLPLMAATPRESAASRAAAEAMLRLIAQAGFSPAKAHRIFRVTKAYVIGAAVMLQASAVLPGAAAEVSEAYPLLRRALRGAGSIDREADFGFGMSLVLDAVEGLRPSRRS